MILENLSCVRQMDLILKLRNVLQQQTLKEKKKYEEFMIRSHFFFLKFYNKNVS